MAGLPCAPAGTLSLAWERKAQRGCANRAIVVETVGRTSAKQTRSGQQRWALFACWRLDAQPSWDPRSTLSANALRTHRGPTLLRVPVERAAGSFPRSAGPRSVCWAAIAHCLSMLTQWPSRFPRRAVQMTATPAGVRINLADKHVDHSSMQAGSPVSSLTAASSLGPQKKAGGAGLLDHEQPHILVPAPGCAAANGGPEPDTRSQYAGSSGTSSEDRPG